MSERRARTENLSGHIDQLIRDRRLHWRLDHALRGVGRLQGFWFNNHTGIGDLRTLIFCTSYINDTSRYRRWLDYMAKRRLRFGAEAVFLINDGSEAIDFDERLTLIRYDAIAAAEISALNLIWFDERLGRPSMFCYPGWWRSFTFSVMLARALKFDKIIHVESDAYILSQRLVDYISRIDRGWTALWSPTYAFPETAIQVICRDAFWKLEEIGDRGGDFFRGCNRAAEYLLPFDKVDGRFYGERCGQLDRERLPSGLDFLTQVPSDWPLRPEF